MAKVSRSPPPKRWGRNGKMGSPGKKLSFDIRRKRSIPQWIVLYFKMEFPYPQNMIRTIQVG
jgi:hypothetical protein